MKRRYVLLFMVMCLYKMTTWGQLSGIYHSSNDWRMVVRDSTLTMYCNPYWGYKPLDRADTIAYCKYRVIADNVIQVSSVYTCQGIEDSITITSFYDGAIGDSLRFEFEIPNSDETYNITWNIDGMKDTSLFVEYNKSLSAQTIYVEGAYNWWGLKVSPKEVSDLFLLENSSLYPLFVQYFNGELFLDNSKNVFIIRIPMARKFFDRYQIIDEYMYVSGDSIKWRGMVFVK